MWGGIGLFDTVQAPEIAGVLKYQDVLVLLGGIFIAFLTLQFWRLSKSFVIVTCVILVLIGWGVLVGFMYQNGGRNIALELRPLLYMLLGVFLANLLDRETIAQNLTLYSFFVAVAILVQFFLFLKGGPVFVNGVVPGNVNSVNLPVVRPQSFHLIIIGLIFAYGGLKSRSRVWTVFVTAVLLAALLVMQSKTYWGLAAFTFLALFLFDQSISIRTKVRLAAIFFIGSIALTLITTPLVNENNQNGGILIIKKITDVFADTQVAYGVVGVRLDEGSLMIQSWRETALTILFGRGLGHMYRDINLFFYRADLRDQERLAMFGHNFYLWLLLKFGLLGTAVFGGLISYTLAHITQKSHILRRYFVLAAFIMLAASVFLGVLESPLGSFLFGLLMFGIVKQEKFAEEKNMLPAVYPPI